MRPTSVPLLLALALLGGVVGHLIGTSMYGDLPPLPAYPPVLLVLFAAVELGIAKVIRDRLHHKVRPGSRPLHPEQIARAAVLAKASSPTGSLLAGAYAGLLIYLLRAGTLRADDDQPVALASAVAALALVAAALWLEHSCRSPRRREDEPE